MKSFGYRLYSAAFIASICLGWLNLLFSLIMLFFLFSFGIVFDFDQETTINSAIFSVLFCWLIIQNCMKFEKFFDSIWCNVLSIASSATWAYYSWIIFERMVSEYSNRQSLAWAAACLVMFLGNIASATLHGMLLSAKYRAQFRQYEFVSKHPRRLV